MRVQEVNEFLAEAAATVAFYDKSLFYATHESTEIDSLKDTSTFAAFLRQVEEIRRFEMRSKARGVGRLAVRDFVDVLMRAHFHQSCGTFMAMYGAALDLLLRRLNRVSKEYMKRKGEMQRNGIASADRDDKYTESSKNELKRRYNGLLQNIRQNLDGTSPKELVTICKLYTNEWKALRASGVVLMDEITFLSKRVDDFHGLLNNTRSIRIAYIALYISTLLTFIGLIFTLKQHYIDEPVNAGLYVERGAMRQKIAGLERFLEVGPWLKKEGDRKDTPKGQ
jgi:hypothetical protein